MNQIYILFFSMLAITSIYGSVTVCGAAGGSNGSVNSITSVSDITFSAVTSGTGSSIIANAGGKTFTSNNNGLVVLSLIVDAITENNGYTCQCLPYEQCPNWVYVTKNGNALSNTIISQAGGFLVNDYAHTNDVYEVAVSPCSGGTLSGGSISVTGVEFTLEMPVCV